MRQIRDIFIALGIGVAWAAVISQIIGTYASTSPGRPAEIDALARGSSFAFVAMALLRDFVMFALPSLFAGYLIVRLMTRPIVFALVAAAPPFLFSLYGVGRVMLDGGLADARGVYAGLNTLLVLAAIPASAALVGYASRAFGGGAPQAG